MKITLKKVINAYRKTKSRPAKTIFVEDGGGLGDGDDVNCCGVGVLALEKDNTLYLDYDDYGQGLSDSLEFTTSVEIDQSESYQLGFKAGKKLQRTYGVDYINGFVTGFDGYKLTKPKSRSEQYKEGYWDGKDIADCLLFFD